MTIKIISLFKNLVSKSREEARKFLRDELEIEAVESFEDAVNKGIINAKNFGRINAKKLDKFVSDGGDTAYEKMQNMAIYKKMKASQPAKDTEMEESKEEPEEEKEEVRPPKTIPVPRGQNTPSNKLRRAFARVYLDDETTSEESFLLAMGFTAQQIADKTTDVMKFQKLLDDAALGMEEDTFLITLEKLLADTTLPDLPNAPTQSPDEIDVRKKGSIVDAERPSSRVDAKRRSDEIVDLDKSKREDARKEKVKTRQKKDTDTIVQEARKKMRDEEKAKKKQQAGVSSSDKPSVNDPGFFEKLRKYASENNITIEDFKSAVKGIKQDRVLKQRYVYGNMDYADIFESEAATPRASEPAKKQQVSVDAGANAKPVRTNPFESLNFLNSYNNRDISDLPLQSPYFNSLRFIAETQGRSKEEVDNLYKDIISKPASRKNYEEYATKFIPENTPQTQRMPDTPPMTPRDAPPDPPPLDTPMPPAPEGSPPNYPPPPNFPPPPDYPPPRDAPMPQAQPAGAPPQQAGARVPPSFRSQGMNMDGVSSGMSGSSELPPTKAELIPKERLSTEGKSPQELLNDIMYFFKNFASQLKPIKAQWDKLSKRQKSNETVLKRYHGMIVGRLQPEGSKADAKEGKVGIVVDAEQYIEMKMREIMLDARFANMQPAELINVNEGIKKKQASDMGAFEVRQGLRGGKSFIQREPVYKAISTSQPEQLAQQMRPPGKDTQPRRFSLMPAKQINLTTTAKSFNSANPFARSIPTITFQVLK